MDEKISPEDFNEISDDLKSEQFELENKMKNHTQADEKFSIAMSTIVSLASNAYNLFMSSNIDEKRELINLIFSNLKLINGELQFSLRSPFDKLVNLASYTIWGEHCEIKTIKVMIVFMSQAMRLFVVRKAFALPIQQI